MDSVERVKVICKGRKLAISKLEKDLGFGNGYISQLRKGMFPADRLAKIAAYLSVSEEYLLYGEEKAPTRKDERLISNDELKFALLGNTENIDDDDLEDVRNYAAFIAERKKKQK